LVITTLAACGAEDFARGAGQPNAWDGSPDGSVRAEDAATKRGEDVRRKTSRCAQPALDGVRRCLGDLVAKYFP
jgi:hypothetical protein